MYTWKYIAVVDNLSQTAGYQKEYVLLESTSWFDTVAECKLSAHENRNTSDYPCSWGVELRIIDEYQEVVYRE